MLTEEQIELLKATSLQDGRNAWEYVHLFDDDKQAWVAAGILSCIEQGLSLRPEIISTEAGNLRYRNEKFEPTKRQLEMVPYHSFWENNERGQRFQEFLPPYSSEDAIREMKARGQYRTTDWKFSHCQHCARRTISISPEYSVYDNPYK
ncbi:MAG: hypothetical protein IKP33_01750 [Prevotella sp.]|nr:hypothetical protein [Prevotella sp.]